MGGSKTESLAILKWDTAADSSLVMTSDLIISDGGEVQMGTIAVPQPFGKVATLQVRNLTTTPPSVIQLGTGKLIMQGTLPTYTRTLFVSGLGTAASPMITADPVDWVVNDRVVVLATSNNANNFLETEERYIKTKNSTTSYVLSSTAGGVETALVYTHLTTARIYNVQRNVIIQGGVINNILCILPTAQAAAGYTELKAATLKNLGAAGGTAATTLPSLSTLALRQAAGLIFGRHKS